MGFDVNVNRQLQQLNLKDNVSRSDFEAAVSKIAEDGLLTREEFNSLKTNFLDRNSTNELGNLISELPSDSEVLQNIKRGSPITQNAREASSIILSLLGQSEVTRTWGTQPESLKSVSSDELRNIFRNQILPAVREAIEAQGLSIDASTCNTCAAYTMIALERLGIQGASLNATGTHITVRVETSNGESLILDPSMAQFLVNDSEANSEAIQRGFIGTEEDLRNFFVQNSENWDFTKHPPSIGKPFDTYTEDQISSLRLLHEVNTGQRTASDEEIRQARITIVGSDNPLSMATLSVEDASQIYTNYVQYNDERREAFELIAQVYRGERNASLEEINNALSVFIQGYEEYAATNIPEAQETLRTLFEQYIPGSLTPDFRQVSQSENENNGLFQSSSRIISAYHGEQSIGTSNGMAFGLEVLTRQLDNK